VLERREVAANSAQRLVLFNRIYQPHIDLETRDVAVIRATVPYRWRPEVVNNHAKPWFLGTGQTEVGHGRARDVST
jgi:hypothetical protein